MNKKNHNQTRSDDFNLYEDMAQTLREIKSKDTEETTTVDNEENQTDDESFSQEVEQSDETAQQPKGEQNDEERKQAADERQQDTKTDEVQVTEQSEDQAQEQQEIDRLEPPASLSAQAKAEFKTLPEHFQREFIKRENDFKKGVEKYKQSADLGKRVAKVIEPYKPIIEQRGLNVDNVIATMLNASYRLSTGTPEQRAQYLAQIARESNIDLNLLVNSGHNQSTAAMPNGQQRNETNAQYEARLARLEYERQQELLLRQQQEQLSLAQQVQAFETARDDKGNLKYPYFQNVREEMADVIDLAQAKGKQITLEQAYQQAIRLNAATFDAVQREQQLKQQAQSKEAAAKKTAAAKARASTNIARKPAQAASVGQVVTQNLTDDLAVTLQRIRARQN